MRRRRPPPRQHNKVPVKVFVIIYLVIAAAMGAGLYFLAAEKRALVAEAPVAEVPQEPTETVAEPVEVEQPAVPEPEPAVEPEPMVIAEVEPEEPEMSPLEQQVELRLAKLYPKPEIESLADLVRGWTWVPKHLLPKLVAIKKTVQFEVKDGGRVAAQGELPPGSFLIPVRINGDTITLSVSGALPVSVTLPIEDTDFKERVTESYERYAETTMTEWNTNRETERERLMKTLAAEMAAAEWNDGSDQRFKPMKASLRQGKVRSHQLDNAIKWRWGGKELIAGTEFEIGFVMMQVDTAFGALESELKAFIQEGKVARWIDAGTGEQL